MNAPTPILMDVGRPAALPFPKSLPEFQQLFPNDAVNTSKRRDGETALSVRTVVSQANRSVLRPARACWHAANADVRQD